MLDKDVRHRECLPTNLTGIGFFPRMRPHVCNQMAARRERLRARLTFVSFTPRMGRLVHCHLVGHHELHFAMIT